MQLRDHQSYNCGELHLNGVQKLVKSVNISTDDKKLKYEMVWHILREYPCYLLSYREYSTGGEENVPSQGHVKSAFWEKPLKLLYKSDAMHLYNARDIVHTINDCGIT